MTRWFKVYIIYVIYAKKIVTIVFFQILCYTCVSSDTLKIIRELFLII